MRWRKQRKGGGLGWMGKDRQVVAIKMKLALRRCAEKPDLLDSRPVSINEIGCPQQFQGRFSACTGHSCLGLLPLTVRNLALVQHVSLLPLVRRGQSHAPWR